MATKEELEEYLRQKMAKHLGALTEDQKTALKQSILEGRAKHTSNVRKEFTKFAQMTDNERKEAAHDSRLVWLRERAQAFFNDAPLTVNMVNALAAELDELKEYEFLRKTDSGKRVLHSADKIRDAAAGLQTDHIDPIKAILQVKVPKLLDVDVPAAQEKGDADAVEKNLKRAESYLEDADAKITKLASSYYSVGMMAKKAADDAVATMNDQAVKAWVKENPDTSSKVLSRLNKTSNSILKVGEKAGKPVPGLPEALKAFRVFKEVVVDRQIEAQIAQRQMKKEKSKHVAGHGFQIMELDPTIMAKRVAQKQIANFKQVLVLIGAVVEEFFPPWDFVAEVLEGVGEAYFQRRVELCALEAKLPPPPEEDPGKEAVKALIDDAEEAVWDLVGDMVESGDFFEVMADALEGINPENVAKAIMKKVTKKVMTMLVKYIDIPPGQPVNASEIRAEALELKSMVKISRTGDPALDHQKLERPTTDGQGRRISRFMQSDLDHDSKGGFYWVKIEGKIGKLYNDGGHQGEFVEQAGGNVMFPTHVKGVLIDEILSTADKGNENNFHLRVRIKDLIGYIDAGATKFTPAEPAKLANWSNRKVDVNSYREGTTTVTGVWTRVRRSDGRADVEYYLFTDAGGRREWADSESATGNNGDKMIKVFAPTKLETVSITELAE